MITTSMFFAALSACIMASVFAAPKAEAAVLTNGGDFPYGAEICAEAAGLTFAPGVAVELHGCHTYTNQQWNLEQGRLYSYGLFEGQTMCMDVVNGAIAPGSKVILTPCSGATSQLWTVGGGPARGQIMNTKSLLCLDGTTMNVGAQLVINTCAVSGLSQQWEVK